MKKIWILQTLGKAVRRARLHEVGETKIKYSNGRTRTVHSEWHDRHKDCVMAKGGGFEH